jgi:short-subunit dehydrogenase
VSKESTHSHADRRSSRREQVEGPDRRALVTGASSGIGAAFVRALRARGERVVLVARRQDRLIRLAQFFGGEPGALPIVLDLTRPGAGAWLEAEMAARRIEVDLLVNNAGVGVTGRFHEQPIERVLAMVDLNMRALVDLTRRFLPPMIARGRGRIINVVSNAAFQPVPYLAVYAASKSFVLSFTEALATELRRKGVKLQALCPGLTETEFRQLAGMDRVAGRVVRGMSPDDVVERSLAALDRGKLRVIPGWPNRMIATAERLVPSAVVRRMAAELFRPRPER